MFALVDKVRQNSGPKPIRLAHGCPNRKKLWRFLKIGGSVSMCVVPPLGPTYIGESAEAYGLKVRCLHGNMWGNTLWTWGTFLEPIRNFKGTPWEHIRKQGKLKEKKILPSPPLNLKGIKTKAPWEHDCTSHWLDEISLLKRVHNIFLPGLLPLANEHPGSIGEKGRILGKTYGFDIRCYWEHPWGTHWKLGEQLGNMVGTHEQLMKKKPLPHSPCPQNPN
jgi:hypothetical protein